MKAWLQGFPAYEGALKSWLEWENTETKSRELREAILAASMPEHWPKSVDTILRLLCGEQKWPLILRPSLSHHVSEDLWPSDLSPLKYLMVEEPTAENVWDAFKKVVASFFTENCLRELLTAGSDPRDFFFAIVVQPRLDAQRRESSASDREALADFPARTELWQKIKHAERIFKRPVLVSWVWDGEQLWFLSVRPLKRDKKVKLGKIDHLLIDLDGTLLGAKNFPLHYNFLKKYLSEFKKYGGYFKAISLLRGISKVLGQPSREQTNEFRVRKVFRDVMGGQAGDAGENILRDVIRGLFPTLERHFYPVPGAKEFLGWAREKFPMTLATNPVWEEDIIKLRLKWAGIDPDFFTSITHSARMRACKPATEYYLELLQQEGLDPARCLLIGDHFRNDLSAAKVGIPVFILSQKDQLKPIHTYEETAPAWHGSYGMLKAILKSSQ